MTDRVIPAVLAVFLGVLLAVVLLVPYVAVQYRRRGTLGVGRAALALAALIYALALVAYVLLPLPEAGPGFCDRYGVGVQLRPFQFVRDVVREGAERPGDLLTNPAALGVAFNVLLFLPAGALVRHLAGRGVVAATLIGFVVSLLIELTQLTGVWTLFPCPYRFFDADDLITNTTGALLGALLAPLLRLVPGQRITAPPDAPRPVTTGRRWLGMFCDLLAVALVGGSLVVAHRALLRYGFDVPAAQVAADSGPTVLLWLVPALGQLAVVWWTGATVGEHVVRLRPADPSTLPALSRLVRWLVGIGGYCLLQLPGNAMLDLFAALLGVAGLIDAARPSQGHRGLAYRAADWQLVDARDPEHRRR